MSNRWSFGGNRLQIKAETRLLADVDAALRATSQICSKSEGNFQSLTSKQELLHLLVENEQMRLVVWLYPLDHERRHIFPSLHSGRMPQEASLPRSARLLSSVDKKPQAISAPLVKTAWLEHPSVAIQLKARFSSPQLSRDIRALLLDCPELATDEPDALQILLGPSLPSDVGSQLKVFNHLHLGPLVG